MKALVTHLRQDGKREKFLVDDWPEPDPLRAGCFTTRTLFSGVTNGTERNDLIGGNYANPNDKLPATWGYQNVGEVTAVGEGVTDVAVGDVVYLSADHVERTTFDTAWKLYTKLPASIDPKEAAIFGMASVAMRTCRHADIRLGERVLVVGAGCIGQIAAQIAQLMGARVTLADVDEGRLNLARGLGAVENAVNTTGTGWETHIESGSFHVVIDVAGVVGMEDKLIAALAPRGRLMLIAGRFKVEYTFNAAQGRELQIRQNSHFDRSDLDLLRDYVALGRIRLAPLIRKMVPLGEARQVYDTLRDAPQTLMGTVFDWRS